MNRNAYFITKPCLIALLLLNLGLSACETNVPEAIHLQISSDSGVVAPPTKSVSASTYPNTSISCLTTIQKGCNVEVYNGFSMKKLVSSKNGVFINTDTPVSPELKHIVFLSAQGAEPQIKMLPSDSDIQLTLNPMADPRSSFLIGCIGRVASGPRGIGLLQHDKPVKIVLQRGRSRQIIYTDIWGRFKTQLPSGRYIMHVGNQHKVIDVPVQDSVIATITLQRMLQN